jgi:methyl-accepting chemotaxis protein
MTDYITLLGAEQVKTAGYAISGAATEISRAAAVMSEAARQISLSVTELTHLVERVEKAAESIAASSPSPTQILVDALPPTMG